jgi:hypothetical protein
MSGVAGRSGRKRFVPTPEHCDLVKLLTTRGIPQEHIRQLVRNPRPEGRCRPRPSGARF